MSDPYELGVYEKRAVRRVVLWVIVLLVILVLVGAGIYWFRVITSPVTGKAEAYKSQQAAENWVRAQKEFEDRYAGIKAYDKNIQVAYDELKLDRSDQRAKVNYGGIVRICNEAVGEYNSLSRSYLSEQFRAADLPYQIDDTDPSTDCKENTK